MKKFLLMIFVVGLSATSAKAQECANGQCTLSKPVAVVTQECEGTCPIAAGMAKLPKMSYMVGSESVCCPDQAKAKSQAAKSPIVFVVGDKKFQSQKDAQTSLVKQTEEFVEAFASPVKCEKSGMICIAGQTCDCPVKAGEVQNHVTKAMKEQNVAFKVGEHVCNCPKEASKLASENKTEVRYLVGETETCCQLEARLSLATARYKAGLMAMNPQAKAAPGSR